MSLLKYIDRLKRMDDLIQRKGTGTAEEFAARLGISVSVLKENLNEMRTLGAEIEFCRTRKSYLYMRQSRLIIKFEGLTKDKEEAQGIKGGKFLDSFYRTIFLDGNVIAYHCKGLKDSMSSTR